MKVLRAGSTEKAATCRMSLIDSLQEINDYRNNTSHNEDEDDCLQWTFTQTDLNHIMRTASLILRRGGLLSTEDSTPYNVYSKERHMLSPAMLDSHSNNIGEYIL